MNLSFPISTSNRSFLISRISVLTKITRMKPVYAMQTWHHISYFLKPSFAERKTKVGFLLQFASGLHGRNIVFFFPHRNIIREKERCEIGRRKELTPSNSRSTGKGYIGCKAKRSKTHPHQAS